MAWDYVGTPANDNISPPAGQGTYYIDGAAGINTVNTNVSFVPGAFTFSQDMAAGVTTLSGASGTGLSMNLHNVQNVAFLNGVTWTVPTVIWNNNGPTNTPFVDTTPPTATAFSPASGATGVNVAGKIVITFSEAVKFGTGNIVLKTAAGAVVETFNVANSSQVLISQSSPNAPNSEILTISPSNNLAPGTQYVLAFDPGAVQDISGNSYAGAAGYTFTTVTGGAPQASIWSLVGNSVNASVQVKSLFPIPVAPATTNVSSVWKWETSGTSSGINYPTWAFYTPTQADGGATYAASKGYDFLTTINAGEGFWVNAQTAFALPLPSGTAISSSFFADKANSPNSLPQGWSLIATGDNPTPRDFVNSIALAQPVSPAVAATSITSLWTWSSTAANWYFYAPIMDNNNTLTSYTGGKGYLDFSSPTAATLNPGTGFWVNHP